MVYAIFSIHASGEEGDELVDCIGKEEEEQSMGIDLTIARVNLAQLRRNIELVRDKLPRKAKLLLAVKGNGYGHGMIAVTRLAEEAGVDYLGVSDVIGAEKLRAAGINLPILIMMPSLKAHVRELVELRVDIAISDLEFARALDQESRNQGTQTPVHINIDTGMGRAGIFPDQVIPFFRELQALSYLKIKGVFSHLSSSYLQGTAHREYTLKQIERFNRILQELDKLHMLPPLRHIASADALVWYKDLVTRGYFNMVRVGELIYGHNIALNRGWNEELKPAMSITTRIIEIRKVPAGHYIGYGRTYRTSSPRRIALLPIGYANGLDLHLSNRGEVAIKGRRAPVVGQICMNAAMVDVTEVDDVRVGDEVEIMGMQVNAEKLAQCGGMELCDILVSFSGIKHIYMNNDQK